MLLIYSDRELNTYLNRINLFQGTVIIHMDTTHRHEDDHGQGHTHSHRHTHQFDNKFKLILVIFFNTLITLAEYIGGMLSGSLALISDAGHNLSDVLSLMLGYAGEKVTEIDPNKRYTFGLKRFEVLIALVNALTLVGVGIFIVYEAVSRFNNPVKIDISIMLIVAVIGLLGNIFSIIVLSRSRNSNLNMKAAFLHLLYDAISSAGVIAAGVIIYFTELYWIDLLFSLVIVIMIVWSSKDIIIESLHIFMQGAPVHIDSDEIYRNILDLENVGDVHGLHIWSINSTEIFLSCHILTDQNVKDINTDELIMSVNRMLEEKYGIEHTTLQIETEGICNLKEGVCCR
jgi:cobalt-zinc-cadmium efflux system protein